MRVSGVVHTKCRIPLRLAAFVLAASACFFPGRSALAQEVASSSAAAPMPAEESATVRFYNRDIVVLRASFLGHKPELRARAAETNIKRIAERWGTPKVSYKTTTEGELILLGNELVTALSPGDVDTLHGQTLEQLRSETMDKLAAAVHAAEVEQAPGNLLKGIAWSLLATMLAMILIGGIRWLGNKARVLLKQRITALPQSEDRKSFIHVTILVRTLADWALRLFVAVTIIFLIEEWLRFVLGRFSFTRPWADAMGSWILHLLGAWASSIASAVPGIITAILIFLFARFVTNTVSFTFRGVQAGKLQLFGIDRELAEPTRKLVVVVIWLFALAMAYPYLPGAHTDAFKGLSVIVGLMVSLGASGIVGQAAGGLTILYSRTMSVGDFVRSGDVEGIVLQIGVFTTRILTVTGVEVSIPNNVVLAGQLHNYSRHPDGPGMWLETDVTIGYDAPWRQVHRLLLEAAATIPRIQSEPQPYVLQTALSDFYTEYRLRVRIPDALGKAQVLSELHAAIQDAFNGAGIQIMSPNYEADPETPKLVKKEYWDGIPPDPPNIKG